MQEKANVNTAKTKTKAITSVTELCFVVHGAVFHRNFFMWYKGDVPNDRCWMERSSLKDE